MCGPLPGLTATTNSATGEADFNGPVVIPVGSPSLPTGKISGPVKEEKRLPRNVVGFLPNLKQPEIRPADPRKPATVDRDEFEERRRFGITDLEGLAAGASHSESDGQAEKPLETAA